MENCPYKCESYFEIGYALMGHASIYFTSVCVMVTTAGFLIVYYIVMGDTMSGVIA
jgi:hypothetical protein